MSRPQWETVWAFVVETAVLEWAQEWSGSSVQQPGPVSPLRENIDFANSGLSSWSESLSHPDPRKHNQCEILLGWSRYRSNKVWLSRDVIYAVIWTIFVKSQQRNEPWPKKLLMFVFGSELQWRQEALVLFQHHQYAERLVMVILVMGRNGRRANIWDGVRVIQDNEECAIWLLMVEVTYEWLVPYPELMKLLSTAWGGPGLNWIWTQIILWLNCPSSCSDHQSQWIKHWITMGLNNFR